MAKKTVAKIKKKSKNIPNGVAHIHSTFNNTIVAITDVTPVPHNGCRPPKRRRV